MRDGSAAVSDEESSDEGEEGDDDEGSVDHASPSKPSRRDSGSLPPLPNLATVDTPMSGLEPPVRPSLHPLESEPKSGSPLKNVVMTTSTLTSPLEASRPEAEFAAPVLSEEHPDIQKLDEELQQQAVDTAPTTLPPVPSHPTEELVQASEVVLAEELEEEDMLLDLDDATHVNIEAPANPVVQSPAPVIAEGKEKSPDLPQIVEPEVKADNSDDDDFPDILDDLEKSLGEPAAVPEVSKRATSLEQVPSSDSDLTVDSASHVEQ